MRRSVAPGPESGVRGHAPGPARGRATRVLGGPAPRLAGELVAAAVLAGLAVAAALALANSLALPTDSWLPQTAMGTLVTGVVLAALAIAALRTRPAVRWAAGVIGPAAASALHQAFLLSGTDYYLNGLGGDQLNRVAYLGRFADSAQLADAFYRDVPPFYPAAWFWVGGRLAALTGTPSWQFYKPFSMFTMAFAGALAFLAWKRLVGDRLAIPLAVVTTGVGAALAAYEPYSWILIALLPALALWSQRLLDPAHFVAVTFYLGLAATTYTLIAGVAVLVTTSGMVFAVVKARSARAAVGATEVRRAVRAQVISWVFAGVGAAVIALFFWAPYLLARLTGQPHEKSVATDFAPEIAASWPLPMLAVSATGVLSLVGLVWLGAVLARRLGRPDLLRRAAQLTSRRTLVSGLAERDIAFALGSIVAIGYVWFALSGLRAMMQSTLLPFRLTPVITLGLALAGVFGAQRLWLVLSARLTDAAAATTRPDRARQLRLVAALCVAVLAVDMSQHVSEEDRHLAANARDSAGEPVALLEAIDDVSGRAEPHDVVILSTDARLFSFRPYWSFQAPAAAYASPMGRYVARSEAIRDWAAATDGDDLLRRMDGGEFGRPDVVVLKEEPAPRLPGDAARPPVWVFDDIVNTMPATSNIRVEPVGFDPALFADPAHFAVRPVDGFVVIGLR